MPNDLTPEAWLEVLLYDFWMSVPQITMTEYERQLDAIRECMA